MKNYDPRFFPVVTGPRLEGGDPANLPPGALLAGRASYHATEWSRRVVFLADGAALIRNAHEYAVMN